MNAIQRSPMERFACACGELPRRSRFELQVGQQVELALRPRMIKRDFVVTLD